MNLFARKILAASFSFAVLGASTLSLAQEKPDIRAKLVVPAAAPAGGTVTLIVEMTLGPTWHVNSHTPTEDYLIGTDVTLASTVGKVGPIRYPKHLVKSFSFSETPLAVYEGTVKFEADVAIPAGASGDVSITGAVSYQACNDSQCFAPAEIPLAGKLTLGGSAAGTTDATATAEISPVAASTSTSGSAHVRFGVQGVPTVLFLSSQGVEIPGTKLAGFEKPVDFLKRLDSVAAGGSSAAGENDVAGLVAKRGLLLTFLAIFLGGLALNLTPCVYPVIPITVGYFSMQAGRDGQGSRRMRTFVLALLYLLGMALTYSALGVAAALTGGLFGAALQSTWATLVIVLVLAALSLSMFGLYEINAPQSILRHAGSQAGYAGALVMGSLVGFVAAPCIGPFVLSLLAYVASTKNPILGFSMFFVLALGLGLPYVILAMTSASIPRAGGWMVAVKHLFGVLMLAVAGWFAKPLPGVNRYLDGFWLPAAILILGGLWIALFEKEGRESRPFAWFLRIAGAAALVAGLWLIRPEPKGIELTWEHDVDAALARAQREGKPVMIDFYATWCIPCKELDKRTFSHPEVAKRLDGFVRLKIDLTKENVKASGG